MKARGFSKECEKEDVVMKRQRILSKNWQLVCFLLMVAGVSIGGIPAVAVAYDYQPDEYGAPCFVDGGAWDPSGGYIQDIAKATLGTNESCACAGTPGCTWDPNPTNPNVDFTNAGKPYYQMVLGCDDPFAAYSMAWTLANEPDWAPEEERVEWCTEAVSYWHKHAHIPYENGYGEDPSGWDWLVTCASELVDWYRIQETLAGGRGRWIDASELSYDDIELGVNVPVPGAYVPIREYDAGTGCWMDWGNGHSLMVDEMWIHTDSLGNVCRIEVKLVEGNSQNRVRNDRVWDDIIEYAPGGSEWIGNRKIFGFGIDLNPDGTPIYDPNRLHYVVDNGVICTSPPHALVTADPFWNEGRFRNLASFAALMKKNGGPDIRSTSIKTGGRLPDGGNVDWFFPAGLGTEVILIDLLDEYPLPIRGIEFRWGNGSNYYVPANVSYSVLYAGEDKQFHAAVMPKLTIPTKNVNPPISCAFDPDGAVKGVRYVKLVFPSGTFPGDAILTELRFWVESPYPEDGEDPPVPSPSLQVATPDGGESWNQGTTHVISWKYMSNPGSTVQIRLLKGGMASGVIAANAPIGSRGSGTFTWKVPYDQALGDDYRVRVIIAGYEDTSNATFRIGAGAPVTVTVPNGGERWKRGTTHTIKWSYTGDPGPNVSIQLLRNGMVNRMITKNTSVGSGGIGTYKWQIPPKQAAGMNYKVQVISLSDPAKKDASNKVFTIGM